jgi:hypothetical protein
MIRKIVFIIFVFISILSCGKQIKYDKEFRDLNEFIEENGDFPNRDFLRKYASSYGLWKVRLANGVIIGKVKSIDKKYSENAMDEAYLGINSEDDYDIIIINTEDNTHKTIIRDKYLNIKLLPIINNRTTETIDDRYIITHQDKIYTPFFKCFILQTIKHDNIYKLIYLDNIDRSIDNIIQKAYEYKSTFIPQEAEITITPNYFIVCHNRNYDSGEEYILINKKTGEYKIIDSAGAIDIDW